MVVSLSSPLVTRSGHSAAVSSIALVVASIPLAGPRRVRPRPQRIPAIPPQRRQLFCTQTPAQSSPPIIGSQPVDTGLSRKTLHLLYHHTYRLFHRRATRYFAIILVKTDSRRCIQDLVDSSHQYCIDWRFAANRGTGATKTVPGSMDTYLNKCNHIQEHCRWGCESQYRDTDLVTSRRRPSLPRRQDRRNDRIGVGGGGSAVVVCSC
jgi:hypothetical protein